MIPKNIHWVWVGGEPPMRVKQCVESWKKFCPDWEIYLWNEKNLPNVSWVKDCLNIKGWAYGFLVDYVKPWALYNYGGIWLDADSEVLKPLDELLDNKAFVYKHPIMSKVSTSFVGAEKGHPLMKFIMDFYGGRNFFNNPVEKWGWNSIYVYDRLIKGFENKNGDIGLKKLLTKDLDKMEDYVRHWNMGTWG